MQRAVIYETNPLIKSVLDAGLSSIYFAFGDNILQSAVHGVRHSALERFIHAIIKSVRDVVGQKHKSLFIPLQSVDIDTVSKKCLLWWKPNITVRLADVASISVWFVYTNSASFMPRVAIMARCETSVHPNKYNMASFNGAAGGCQRNLECSRVILPSLISTKASIIAAIDNLVGYRHICVTPEIMRNWIRCCTGSLAPWQQDNGKHVKWADILTVSIFENTHSVLQSQFINVRTGVLRLQLTHMITIT